MKHFLDMVTESYETLLIPRTNEDDAVVIMPLSEYNSLIETNYLNSSQNNKKRLEKAIEEVNNGEVIEVNI